MHSQARAVQEKNVGFAIKYFREQNQEGSDIKKALPSIADLTRFRW